MSDAPERDDQAIDDEESIDQTLEDAEGGVESSLLDGPDDEAVGPI